VGTLAPGAEGIITLELARHIAQRIYTNTVTIAAANDADVSNNTAQATVRHAFLQPPILLNPVDGTTCDGDFTGANEVLGLTTEFATVDLYVDGVLTVTLQAGGSGYFRHSLTLPDGVHELYAVAHLNGHDAVGETRTIIVNSALTWDPISLRFKLDGGGYYRPTDADGRTDESGWEIHLLANRTYTASVRLCCESPTAQVTLDVNGTLITLTDPDGDGVYEGVIITPSTGTTVTSTLAVNCNGVTTQSQSQVLIDPDGVVYDANTGAKLSGASVMCLQQNDASLPATGSTYTAWPAANFGQVNPQTTQTDGYFAFFTPPGVYRLDVNKAGYQPYRSPDLRVVSMPVRHDAPLTPIVSEPAQVTILIGENGFEPAVVRVAPGAVVAFVNGDVRDHNVKGTPAAAAITVAANVVTPGGFDSGALGPGQRFTIKLNSPGTFTLSDASEADAAGAVIAAPIGGRVLLPLIRR
jgi:plastocyanin